MRAYLDASVLLPTLVIEAGSAAAARFLESLDQGPVVSDFTASEVASGVSRLVRMGLLQVPDATRKLATFDSWCAAEVEQAEIRAVDVRMSATFVRRFELMLRAPDALHVAVCRRLDATLVTLDRRLAAAARRLGLETELLVAS